MFRWGLKPPPSLDQLDHSDAKAFSSQIPENSALKPSTFRLAFRKPRLTTLEHQTPNTRRQIPDTETPNLRPPNPDPRLQAPEALG